MDTYARYKINQKYNKGVSDYNTAKFRNEYAFLKHPVCQKGKAKEKLHSVIASYSKRLVNEVQLVPPQTYIGIHSFIHKYTHSYKHFLKHTYTHTH